MPCSEAQILKDFMGLIKVIQPSKSQDMMLLYIYIYLQIYIYIYHYMLFHCCSYFMYFQFCGLRFLREKTSQQFPMASHHQPRGSPAPCRLASNTRYCRCLCNLEPTRAIIQWVTAVASCLELSETVPNSIFSPFKMELEPWLTILVFK